jgi:hypothetical protein
MGLWKTEDTVVVYRLSKEIEVEGKEKWHRERFPMCPPSRKRFNLSELESNHDLF